MEPPAKAVKRRRQGHISVACQACKNRRSKCSGGPPPCSLCAKLETECHFDPDADMRRRTSRDSTKTFKALLDAFVNSLRRDDGQLSQSLHQVIVTADPSGRLREVAEEYAESIRPGWLLLSQSSQIDGIAKYDDAMPGLNLDLPTIEDLDEYLGVSAYSFSSASSPMSQNLGEPSNLIGRFQSYPQVPQGIMATSAGPSTSQIPYQHMVDGEEPGGSKDGTTQEGNVSKDDLKAYLQEQLDNRQLTIHDLPILSCDLFVSVPEPHDQISRSIMSFRDSARRAISNGLATESILDTAKPDLTLMFRDRKDTDLHTVWSWACDFGKAFDNFSFPLRLAHVYMAGIQMRVRIVFITTSTACNNLTVLYSSLCRDFQRLARDATAPAETIQGCAPRRRRHLPYVGVLCTLLHSLFQGFSCGSLMLSLTCLVDLL